MVRCLAESLGLGEDLNRTEALSRGLGLLEDVGTLHRLESHMLAFMYVGRTYGKECERERVVLSRPDPEPVTLTAYRSVVSSPL